MMEKFDTEDQLEEFSGLPSDDEVSWDESESWSELDTIEEGDKEVIFPTYGELTDREWPVYSYKVGEKTLQVVHDDIGTMWHIQFKEGGPIDNSLKGKFTSESEAKQAVEIYLNSKK
jgi:hypothetical protein